MHQAEASALGGGKRVKAIRKLRAVEARLRAARGMPPERDLRSKNKFFYLQNRIYMVTMAFMLGTTQVPHESTIVTPSCGNLFRQFSGSLFRETGENKGSINNCE